MGAGGKRFPPGQRGGKHDGSVKKSIRFAQGVFPASKAKPMWQLIARHFLECGINATQPRKTRHRLPAMMTTMFRHCTNRPSQGLFVDQRGPCCVPVWGHQGHARLV
jgi:hypothetical protein